MPRIAMVVLMLAAVFPAIGVSARSASLPEGVPAGAVEARLWGYIDGDKFNVRIGDKTEELNTIGADAPEMDEDLLSECFAKEASDKIKELVPKTSTIYLEQDTTDRDGKDRILRYVWVPGKDGAKAFMLNERIVKLGYAAYQEKDDNLKYRARLKGAEESAKEAKRGLWKSCDGPHELVSPTEAPTPTKAAVSLESGGLGLSRSEWEAKYGSADGKDSLGYDLYDGGRLAVMFLDDRAWSIDINIPEASPVRFDDARTFVSLVVPFDAVLVETYSNPAMLNSVDHFNSAYLLGRFTDETPVGNITLSMWPEGNPGDFISIFNLDPNSGLVTHIIIGLGNNP